MSRLVLFMFAGRQVNMEVQIPYLSRLLESFSNLEVHLWDLTRTPADQRYLQTLAGGHDGRVQVLGHLHGGFDGQFPAGCLYPGGSRPHRRGYPRCECMVHKPPYEKPYAYYAEQGDEISERTMAQREVVHYNTEDRTIYIKVDDDVLFLETDRFADLISPLADHPNRVISANVINNAVCAKYQVDAMVTANKFAVGDPADPKNDKRWWALHTDREFASWCHARFLNFPAGSMARSAKRYVRTRPGEAVSINCIAFTHRTMIRVAAMMDDRLGDEGAFDRLLPWICLTFHAAHLSFGPQETNHGPQLAQIRNDYWQLSKEYLR